MKVKTLSLKNAQYPPLLREIPSPPKKIFYLGKIETSGICVAIVGSRKNTDYGQKVTYRLSYDLASAGVVIVSGLAFGIDSIAHKAAIDAKGKTIAVLACGLDRIYPQSNKDLAKKILATGGSLISEHPIGTPPLKHNFPARNRIISGLSLATLITEAPAHSGALITANFALEQNRLTMSVPGNITSKYSEGANNLIKSGAIVVSSANDILRSLDIEVPTLKAKIAKPASKDEAVILNLLAQDITDSEEIIAKSGLDTQKFNQVITLMEISGKVRSIGGGKWTAV